METETETGNQFLTLHSHCDQCENDPKIHARRIVEVMTTDQKRKFLMSLLTSETEDEELLDLDSEDDIRGALVAPL